MRGFRYLSIALLIVPLHGFSQKDSTLSRSGEKTLQQAQDSPYHFNWKKDLIVASSAGLLTVGGIYAQSRVQPFTIAQVNALDPYAQPGFDRSAIGNWSPEAATASDVLLYGSFALPGLMMLNKRMRKDFLVVGFIYAEVVLFTYGLTGLTKGLAKRPRPYVYDVMEDMDIRTTRDARQSFFSGHASVTAALSFATAKIFSDHSDNPTHEALVWTGAIILPAVTSYLRFAAGKHFPSDIITGYLVGATIGYLVPWLHRRKPIVKGMGLVPYSNGKNELGVYFSYRL